MPPSGPKCTARVLAFAAMSYRVPVMAVAAFAAVLEFGGTEGPPYTRGGGTEGPPYEEQVDTVFAKWSTATPGCAVGVAENGSPVLTRAYGMADLEQGTPNTPDTIFEAGSVSKQFTAAAVLLLARDGKLSLDDPARKYIPELPDYGAPLTIRHMLTHTSGLRDWGSVEGIAGWPRTTRAYTHAHVLDIVSRQRALNFPSGTRWSYSNTGFNLAAIIVSRVSGQSFADFTHARLFAPLGMTHTSWRDDHTRIVKGRATAYAEAKDGFHIEMPFEDVYGNGGLLTTVGDLLKWNEHFVSPATPADKAWVEQQQEIGAFSDGRQHDYAFGLWINDHKGVKNVWHSGSTAGYRAHLNRFPAAHLSVAVLCNVSTGEATKTANDVSDLYLASRLKPAAATAAAHVLTAAEATALAGLYRNTATGLPTSIRADGASLTVAPDTALTAISATRFVTTAMLAWEFDGRDGARSTDPFGRIDTYQRVAEATPSAAELKALAGVYDSDEAEATLTVVVVGTSLVMKRRPDTTMVLTPIYADAFRGASIGTVIFRRTDGRVTGLSVIQDRVWDLRFQRQMATDDTPIKRRSGRR